MQDEQQQQQDGGKGATVGGSLLSDIVNEIVSSPVNLALVCIISFLLYKMSKTRQPLATLPPPPPELPRLRRDFTLAELKQYDGTQPDGRVLTAVNGNVYDVTKGKAFYGPARKRWPPAAASFPRNAFRSTHQPAVTAITVASPQPKPRHHHAGRAAAAAGRRRGSDGGRVSAVRHRVRDRQQPGEPRPGLHHLVSAVQDQQDTPAAGHAAAAAARAAKAPARLYAGRAEAVRRHAAGRPGADRRQRQRVRRDEGQGFLRARGHIRSVRRAGCIPRAGHIPNHQLGQRRVRRPERSQLARDGIDARVGDAVQGKVLSRWAAAEAGREADQLLRRGRGHTDRRFGRAEAGSRCCHRCEIGGRTGPGRSSKVRFD
ncbi:uncharacterized protein LOC120906846 isoform X1 [Anopheles arabiensis]|uniref:uncharacterized protein LOC120906846 isoform X1 n=1 Tax=Anopheles arabiensis TaxID=7173 RepID=UPI001AAD8768|nr:uncharacterized protein LOC120906846 isoform X1 [Anopheles arabiensis]XP_040174866.1 uncharacterized protein LOC120906846 isoform X1 [Anopheles arabiensis]